MLRHDEHVQKRRLRLGSARHWSAFAGVAAAAALGTSGCSDEDDNKGNGNGSAGTAGSTGMAGSAGMVGGGPMPVIARGAAPNGLSLPDDLLDWRVIGVVQRPDDDSIRVVVGNDTAVGAARVGRTNPWPDGAMLAHYVWASGNNPNNDGVNPDFLAPKEFRAVTLMHKNSQDFADDGGWAYGIWRGSDLEPPADPAFDRACVSCHTMHVSDNDYVFTIPGALPRAAAVGAAADAPNGVSLPDGFLDWRVIGAISRPDSIRVIVGNDVAVDAARDGQLDTWPEGSMLGHFVWAPSENAASVAALSEAPIAPGDFTAVTLMIKDSDEYAADGGWAYGIWNTLDLNPPTAMDFDRACVNCHISNVADNDYVFTLPGDLP